MPVARRRGMKELDELVIALRTRREEALIREVTEAMTTNESLFFRDIKPFELFRHNVLPRLLESRASRKSFRVWCAAAASGQEPYTIAMILKEEAAKLAGWRNEIIGTDISSEMLAKAKAGLYSQFEVQRGLPIQLLLNHFSKRDDLWQIDASLRAMVQYREYNLLDDLGPMGTFDVIFLPQRFDLLRPADQGQGSRPARPSPARRWRALPGRRRDGARHHGQVQTGRRAARRLLPDLQRWHPRRRAGAEGAAGGIGRLSGGREKYGFTRKMGSEKWGQTRFSTDEFTR